MDGEDCWENDSDGDDDDDGEECWVADDDGDYEVCEYCWEDYCVLCVYFDMGYWCDDDEDDWGSVCWDDGDDTLTCYDCYAGEYCELCYEA